MASGRGETAKFANKTLNRCFIDYTFIGFLAQARGAKFTNWTHNCIVKMGIDAAPLSRPQIVKFTNWTCISGFSKTC